jgi:hypothetical protein
MPTYDLIEERNAVRSGLELPISDSKSWNVVACEWFERWKVYVGWDPYIHTSDNKRLSDVRLCSNSCLFAPLLYYFSTLKFPCYKHLPGLVQFAPWRD